MENPAKGVPPLPEYTPGQLLRVASVYDFMARLLPTEGRDYKVNIAFPDKDDPGHVSISFDHYTKIGKVWCDYCMEELKGKTKLS